MVWKVVWIEVLPLVVVQVFLLLLVQQVRADLNVLLSIEVSEGYASFIIICLA